MTKNAVWLNVDDDLVAPAFEKALETLECSGGEVLLDLSRVRRIDAGALRTMEKLVGMANEKAVKVVLRGAHVDVYKVLKLTKLASRFSFLG